MKQYDLNLANANLLLHEYKCVDYFEKVNCCIIKEKIVGNLHNNLGLQGTKLENCVQLVCNYLFLGSQIIT